MKYCSNCGEKTGGKAKFCGYCGYNIASSEEGKGTTEFVIASSSKRLLNLLVDYTVGALGGGFLVGLLLATIGLVSGNETDEFWTFVGCIVILAYYVSFEVIWGKSLGKMVTKTRVLMQDGSKPTLKAIIIRSLSRFIPFDAFSFFGNKPVGWHDSISKTVVVED